MARAAGSGRNYTVAIVDTRGKVVEELAGFPSVTTIIGDADASKANGLMGWAYNVGLAGVAELLESGKIKAGDSDVRIKAALKTAKLTPWSNRDKAATRGSSIHDYAEQLLAGRCTYDDVLEGTPPAEAGYARALISWHEAYDRHPVALERVMVSLTHRYAGTVDLIDELELGSGVHRVADFKTSKSIYDAAFIQDGAYAHAWLEMNEQRGTPVVVDEVAVIRLGSDGKFEEQTRPYTGADVFLKMRELYRARNGE